ncbi:MAG: hypothetical protein KGS10_05440, partial [Chloroflexi bacterium]|nr:hypothetical protein [Chloroflexota bacterium]
MPICSVHRAVPYVSPILDGTQYLTGALVLPSSPSTATVWLSNNVYATGTYALFDYSASTAPTPVTNLSQLVVDVTDLLYVGSASVTNDTGLRQVLMTLYGKSDNGTQYVDGTLTISGPIVIEMSEVMHASPGTYVLFEYGSLVGSITNITILPPGGRSVDTGVSPNGCADT